MPAYFIVEIKTKSEDKASYAEYIAKVRPIVEKYGGRYLARGGRVIPVFGGWDPERIIVIEFPCAEDVRKWLDSAEYKNIAGLREKSTLTKAIIVEGCAGK
jgi:uncharacterized protein (DUF1330 family)